MAALITPGKSKRMEKPGIDFKPLGSQRVGHGNSRVKKKKNGRRCSHKVGSQELHFPKKGEEKSCIYLGGPV